MSTARDLEEAVERGSDGDARRCPRHPHVRTSSADGMFDAPCNECEAEGESQDHEDDPPPDYAADIPIDLARRAHSGTSFDPERRGDSERAQYASQLADDYAALAAMAGKHGTGHLLDAEFARYRMGMRRRFIVMLGSKSACVSTMIAGRSNFNVRRAQKRSDAADRRTRDLIEFRERALKAMRRTLVPGEGPIMAGASDAVEALREKIEKAERFQERMKIANATIRKHKKGGPDAQVAALVALGYSEGLSRKMLEPDSLGRIGFADYETTNNNANIRRMKQRLAVIEHNKAVPTTEADGEHARVEDNPAENRVRIYFGGKPPADVRNRLKAGGFRWSPSIGAWSGYRHDHTVRLAREIAGVSSESAA